MVWMVSCSEATKVPTATPLTEHASCTVWRRPTGHPMQLPIPWARNSRMVAGHWRMTASTLIPDMQSIVR